MARNCDSNLVRPARLRDRALSRRLADRLCNRAVAACLARGNLPKRLPHTLLKRRPANIERQIKRARRLLDQIDHPPYSRRQLAFRLDQPRLRKPRLHRLACVRRQRATAAFSVSAAPPDFTSRGFAPRRRLAS
jgi:hypothetical protein